MPPPTADRDPAAKVAFVSGAAANAGGVSGLHARLLLFPAYKALVDLLHRLGITGRRVVIAIPYLWLLAFFLAPFLIVLKISFAEIVIAMPPYTPLITFMEDGWIAFHASIDNYLLDRKSTRLNSTSLMRISYAVFC